MIEANEPEAELFALAKQVDLAEKAFHEAHARRNKAHIAYLREPNILTRGIRHTGPMAGQNSRHDGHRAQVEGVIRFDGRQARRQHHRRHLATLRTGKHETLRSSYLRRFRYRGIEAYV